MKTRGRPSSYTPEIAEEICDRLSAGEPLRNICRDEHMPAWRTVYNWISLDIDGFAARIAHARDLGFDAIAEQCIDIADDEQHDWLMSKKGVITNEVAIGRAKLQVDTRLKLLAKWSPKYRENSKIELAGQLAVSSMTEDEMRAELAALAAAGVIPVEKPDDDISDLL